MSHLSVAVSGNALMAQQVGRRPDSGQVRP